VAEWSNPVTDICDGGGSGSTVTRVDYFQSRDSILKLKQFKKNQCKGR